MGSLRAFIKAVRKSKTQAGERAVIRKESAHLRAGFRDPHMDNDRRNKYIQKMIYLYILGEATHFGQVECLKLLASPRLYDKRIAYAAAMLIFDDSQDILTLLTNSLDLDLKSTDMFVVSLALCALGNLASPELAKDLYPQVEKLLGSSLVYIKKKALTVAGKLVEVDPSLAEIFVPYVRTMFADKDHGVLLGALHLAEVLFEASPATHDAILRSTPNMLAHLNFLGLQDYSPEYTVKGIPDPFLMVALLRTLRVVATGISSENLERFNDILTQVCARFETAKGTASHAILYECVRTIFAIDSDSSLKILGVNILSSFLTQKDNNIRYVALNTLLQVISHEPLAVQRHRAIIVGCLADPDVSIRRRALELVFAIMTQQNVKLLTKEVMVYLARGGDEEIMDYATNQLTISMVRLSSDPTWLVTNLLALLKTSGNFINEGVLSIILATLIRSERGDLLAKEIGGLDSALYDQYGLALVALWCLGEYSSAITDPMARVETILGVASFTPAQRDQIKLYALNALVKMSAHTKADVKYLIQYFTNDINVQVQTRAVEYLRILGEPESVRGGLLEKIPPPPVKHYTDVSLMNVSESAGEVVSAEPVPAAPKNNILMDLLGDDFGIKDTGSSVPAAKVDILSDLFGGMSTGAPATVGATEKPEPTTIEAYKDAHVRVGFAQTSNANGKFAMEISIRSLEGPLSGLSIQCAVPKSQRLQLAPLATNTLASGQHTQLRAEVSGPSGSRVKLRVKLSYVAGGAPAAAQFDFGGFSENIL